MARAMVVFFTLAWTSLALTLGCGSFDEGTEGSADEQHSPLETATIKQRGPFQRFDNQQKLLAKATPAQDRTTAAAKLRLTPRLVMMCGNGGLVINADETIRRAVAREFTLEMWVMTIYPGKQHVLTMGNLQVTIDNGFFHIRAGTQALMGPRALLWVPVHLALVNDATTLRIFANGQLLPQIENPTAPVDLGNVETLVFGAADLVETPCGTTSLCGAIDNIQLNDTARYDSDGFFPPLDVEVWPTTIFGYTFDGPGGDLGPYSYRYELKGLAALVRVPPPPVCR